VSKDRLEFIEGRLAWLGALNRRDVADRFGVTVQVVSADLSAYEEVAPGNVVYDRKEKILKRSPTFSAALVDLTPDAVLEMAALGLGPLAGAVEAVAVSPVDRHICPDVLRGLAAAVSRGMSVQIEHTGIGADDVVVRRVTPFVFVRTGTRWHVRGWCHLRDAVRDFVLGRILRVSDPIPSDKTISDDPDWSELFEMELVPNSMAPLPVQETIRRDYGFPESGMLRLRIRKAFLFYVTKGLRLDEIDAGPERRPLELVGTTVVEYSPRNNDDKSR